MITITKEMVANARTYIPLEEKRKWCETVSNMLIVRVPMKTTNTETGKETVIPDRFEEQPIGRQMALTALLVKSYLGIMDDTKKLGADDYDEYIGSFIPNQLERLKSDKDVKNKVFDILYDFNEVKKMLNTVIFQKLGHLNDPTVRLMAYLTAITLKDVMRGREELEKAKKDIEEYAGTRE